MIRDLIELAAAAILPAICIMVGLITMSIAINHHTQEKARERRARARARHCQHHTT